MNIEMLKDIMKKGYDIVIKNKGYYVFSGDNNLVCSGYIDSILSDEDIYWNKMCIEHHDDNSELNINIKDVLELV